MMPETRKSLFLCVFRAGSLELVCVGAVKGRKIAVVARGRHEEAVLLLWAFSLGCAKSFCFGSSHELYAFCVESTVLIEYII